MVAVQMSYEYGCELSNFSFVLNQLHLGTFPTIDQKEVVIEAYQSCALVPAVGKGGGTGSEYGYFKLQCNRVNLDRLHPDCFQ